MTRLSGTRRLVQRTAEPLVHRGILKHERVAFLLFFERSVFPTVDPGPEKSLIDEIGRAISAEASGLSVRTRVMIGIADVTGMLRAAFDREELKAAKQRLKAIRESEPFSDGAEIAVAAAVALMAASTG